MSLIPKVQLRANVERDTLNSQKLLDLGYRIATVWGCSLKGKFKLPLDKITRDLDSFIQSNDKTICIHGLTGQEYTTKSV